MPIIDFMDTLMKRAEEDKASLQALEAEDRRRMRSNQEADREAEQKFGRMDEEEQKKEEHQLTQNEEKKAETPKEDTTKTDETQEYEWSWEKDGVKAEVPEFLRSSIKNKEQYDELRKMMSSPNESMHKMSEDKYKALDEQYRNISDRAHKSETAVSLLNKMSESKDIEGLKQMLGITEEDLINHVAKGIKQEEIDPNYRQQTRPKYDPEQYFKSQDQERQQAEYVRQQIMNEMSQPEVMQAQQEYDRVMGYGAFHQRVTQTGSQMSRESRGLATPRDVVQRVVKELNWNRQTQTPPPAQKEKPQVSKLEDRKEKPVIKTIDESRGTPVGMGKQYETFDDMIEDTGGWG